MKAILFFTFLLASGSLKAHAIWIETNSAGKLGKAQEVRVYFGEYSENERDSAGHWFSDLGKFHLWAISPGGTKSELTTKEAGNAYSVKFTPTEKGVYTFAIDHLVADVYYQSLIHYYAVATTVIDGSVVGEENLAKATDLAFNVPLNKIFQTNENVEVDVFYQEKPATEVKFSVQPPLGWTKEFTLNEKGHGFFKPFIDGKYMMEGFLTENTSGTHNGKEYGAIWHCVTYCVDVKKVK